MNLCDLGSLGDLGIAKKCLAGKERKNHERDWPRRTAKEEDGNILMTMSNTMPRCLHSFLLPTCHLPYFVFLLIYFTFNDAFIFVRFVQGM